MDDIVKRNKCQAEKIKKLARKFILENGFDYIIVRKEEGDINLYGYISFENKKAEGM